MYALKKVKLPSLSDKDICKGLGCKLEDLGLWVRQAHRVKDWGLGHQISNYRRFLHEILEILLGFARLGYMADNSGPSVVHCSMPLLWDLGFAGVEKHFAKVAVSTECLP